jgi:23S rRNA (uridine2552-2'-O)-methyltransferase
VYQRKDTYYARAKAAGYRSRAAFKLQQLAASARLFRPGDHVVDLGAWPGGWLQVAAQHVGPSGKVVGVDVRLLDPLPERNVIILAGDITETDTQERVALACEGRADVILSDLAPKLSGVRARDEAQADALADCVLRFAGRLLRPGGHLVVKLFTRGDVARYVARLREQFSDVRTTRPEATRKRSAEIYAVAKHFRGAGGMIDRER